MTLKDQLDWPGILLIGIVLVALVLMVYSAWRRNTKVVKIPMGEPRPERKEPVVTSEAPLHAYLEEAAKERDIKLLQALATIDPCSMNARYVDPNLVSRTTSKAARTPPNQVERRSSPQRRRHSDQQSQSDLLNQQAGILQGVVLGQALREDWVTHQPQDQSFCEPTRSSDPSPTYGTDSSSSSDTCSSPSGD